MKIFFIAATIYFYFCFTIFASSPLEKIFSAELSQTSVAVAIQAMAAKVGADYAISEEVSKKIVSVSVKDKTIREALDILGAIANFNWSFNGDTIYISAKEDMVQAGIFKLKYLDPVEVRKQLVVLVPEEKIVVNIEDSSLIVSASTAELARIAQIISQIDMPVEQIHIAVQMIELGDGNTVEAGLSHTWTDWAWKSNKLPVDLAPLDIMTTLSAEQTLNKGRIIASPSLTTLGGREASVLMGSREPILETQNTGTGVASTTVRYEEVGYKITVLPRVTQVGGKYFVTLKLNPSVSAITGWVRNSDSTAPQISTREAETNITVQSGEMIIIGGLVKDEDVRVLRQVPGLSKIPFFGELFKYRSNRRDKSVVYICVTPTVVTQFDNPFVLPGRAADELGKLKEIENENGKNKKEKAKNG
jgi:type II secretory pathway component GspD/PulD (secretin)